MNGLKTDPDNIDAGAAFGDVDVGSGGDDDDDHDDDDGGSEDDVCVCVFMVVDNSGLCLKCSG